MTADLRLNALKQWLHHSFDRAPIEVSLLSGDASFRRYFRVRNGNESYVAMDAPPNLESCESYIAISQTFRHLQLNTPEIIRADTKQGFLLITDFGDSLLLNQLNDQSVDQLYQLAFESLLRIVQCKQIEQYQLPYFDQETYLKEMRLFQDWYLEKMRGIRLTVDDQRVLEDVYTLLIKEALSQPQVCVHRDYHSRNLMIFGEKKLAILDFQDALWGPITYDCVSLLRDCYIDWPISRVKAWALRFQQQLYSEKLLSMDDPHLFMRWFDWMGLQRHLKCIGIFARLKIRDHKSNYVLHIPRIIRYINQVAKNYPEFRPLLALFDRLGIAP